MFILSFLLFAQKNSGIIELKATVFVGFVYIRIFFSFLNIFRSYSSDVSFFSTLFLSFSIAFPALNNPRSQ